VDEIAERIRAIGAPAPGSYAAFSKLTGIKESETAPPAVEMVRQLAADQDLVARSARTALEVARAADDEVSADLAITRMQIHEKNAWMLRSHLE
jgi:starvation-inducible DNA-binding protein